MLNAYCTFNNVAEKRIKKTKKLYDYINSADWWTSNGSEKRKQI